MYNPARLHPALPQPVRRAVRLSACWTLLCVCALAVFATGSFAAETGATAMVAPAASTRLRAEHLLQLGDVSEPQISPESDWIAYTVSRDDEQADESRSRVWMVPSRGGDAMPLTAEDESSSHPRWSPDGKYLAFLSSRKDRPTQVFRLARLGGEAVALTDTVQAVNAFEWSPDSKTLVLVLQDPTEAELAAADDDPDNDDKAPAVWVIDRQQFKTDYVGYLDRRRQHLHLLDIASGEQSQLTFGDYDDEEPRWSADGSRIAFTSNRSENPDSNYNTDIWTVAAFGSDQTLRQITTNPGADASPSWSPDGKSIVHTSITDVAASVYATQHLAVSAADGSGSTVLTAELDRMIFQPAFTADSKSILFLLETTGEQILAKMPASGGTVERLIDGRNVAFDFQSGADGRIAALVSQPQQPSEVFLLDGKVLEQRSFTNQALLQGLQLAEVVQTRFSSADGTPIEGFIIKPPGFVDGKRYPVILDIHGGPQAQYDWSWHFEAQLYAAQGWLVVHPNPRGSTGYGQQFCLGIWQDWGGPDFEDVMAAVDDAIDKGWGDREQMGVAGWSYGGILTNHVITKTDRFDAAITGASEVLYVVNYGHDQYQRWWEQELGLPWEPEARKIYERMSPFNRVDRVTTPTLILGGEEDWNVPIINSEELYLALKRLGVDTQLIVYPGEYHGIGRPSYKQDLYRRYIDWFSERLKP